MALLEALTNGKRLGEAPIAFGNPDPPPQRCIFAMHRSTGNRDSLPMAQTLFWQPRLDPTLRIIQFWEADPGHTQQRRDSGSLRLASPFFEQRQASRSQLAACL